MLAALHLCLRHGMTGPLVEDVLKFANLVLGAPVIPTSEYIFKKLFPPKYPAQVHFYRPGCEFYLGNKQDLELHKKEKKDAGEDSEISCDNCQKKCNTEKLENNFFLTIPIKDQLEDLLKDPTLKFVTRDKTPEVYCDVVDGDLYQELIQPGNLMEDKNSLSLTFNTDGAKVFKSPKGSIYPLQCVVNELSQDIRFKSDNVLLCGLWYGTGAPSMSTFLAPFKKELNDGLTVSRPCPNNEVLTCPVFALICSVDAVCRCKVQNIKQFNGKFSCGYCYHPNYPVADLPKNQLRFVAVSGDGSELRFPERTHQEIVNDMIKAHDLEEEGLLARTRVGTDEETFDHVNGIKGLSAVADLKGFDLVYGFVIDYLHQLPLGVVETVVGLLCNGPVKSSKFWLNGEYNLSKLNARLEAIKPPHNMSHETKAIGSKTEKWNAKDWRSLLLYYMLPCLEDLLKEPVYLNLKDLVEACHILLSDRISSEELDHADSLLQRFVTDFNGLYGDFHMTYNIHCCTHLAKIVRCWGPLPGYSCFVFESGNGRLKRLVEGTRGVVTQICRKFLTVRSIPKLVERHPVSDRTLSFCSDVIGYNYVQSTEKLENARTFGDEKLVELTDEEKLLLSANNIAVPEQMSLYNRVVQDGLLYCCSVYTRPERFDDTCVSLMDNTFAVIEKIVKIPGLTRFMAFVRPIRIVESEHFTHHILPCAADMFGQLTLVPMSHIVRKCVRVTVDGVRGRSVSFVCTIPNFYEKD